MQPAGISRAATTDDLDAMAETLTSAFADDPVWGAWAFPDPGRAVAQRRAFMGLWVRTALRYRAVRVTPRCEAVAVWFPPGESENTADYQAELVSMAHALLGDHAALFLEGCDVMEATHPMERSHHYLALLGTHEKHRGKGLGMRLLAEDLARIDAEGMPAYLESTNPGNLPRYERLGFVKMGAYAFPRGATVDMMWREPVAPAPEARRR